MPIGNPKGHRYAMRLDESLYQRFRHISMALMAPLPDVIATAVLFLFAHATNPSEYHALKSKILAKDAIDITKE